MSRGDPAVTLHPDQWRLVQRILRTYATDRRHHQPTRAHRVMAVNASIYAQLADQDLNPDRTAAIGLEPNLFGELQERPDRVDKEAS